MSGAAALIWARWPTLSREQVEAQLRASVVDAGIPGRDDRTGWGRIDLARALAAPASPVDLRLSGQTLPDHLVAGGPLSVTLTVANNSGAPATSVTLDAALPAAPVLHGVLPAGAGCSIAGQAVRCGFAWLAGGATVSVFLVVTTTTGSNGVLTTTASVEAAQRELRPEDNEAKLETSVRPVLSGRVFLDGNGDGVRQTWETRGIGGAYLLLEQEAQPVAFSESRPPDGAFQFDVLADGDFVLIAELPTGYKFTTPDQMDIRIDSSKEQTVHFGAWAGEPQPPPAPPVFLPLISNR